MVAKRIRRPRKKPVGFQAELSRMYGKVSAYYKLGMMPQAKEWAGQLQQLLIDEGLLDRPDKPGG